MSTQGGGKGQFSGQNDELMIIRRALTSSEISRIYNDYNPPSCTDDCNTGQKRCNGNYTETCGNYDSDSCSEWGNSTYCPNGCSNGICVIITTGSLNITSNPSGAVLYINTGYYGSTPYYGSGFSVGNYNLLLIKPGYNDYTTTAYISGGATTSLNITLTLPQSGSLNITSSPQAYVYVDNVSTGWTPYYGINYSVSDHNIKLVKSGYNNYTTTVHIYSGQTTYVTATLVANQTNQTNNTGSLSITSNPSSAKVYVNNFYKG